MQNVRVFFRKKGRLKYISHLDLNRIMLRFVRMAKLPIMYTQGYHPRPCIAIAAPLPLGYESDYEAVDLKMAEQVEPYQVEQRFKSILPPGIELIKVAEPVFRQRDIAYAEYEVKADFCYDIADVLKSKKPVYNKKTKSGNIKQIDIFDNVKQLDYSNGVLRVTLTCSNEGGVNPSMLISAADESAGESTQVEGVKRTMLYIANGEEFK